METNKQFDYAILMLCLTVALMVTYAFTRDALLGDLAKISLGSTITAFGTRVTYNTVGITPTQANRIVQEFNENGRTAEETRISSG